MIDYPSFDNGFSYPDQGLPSTGLNSPFAQQTQVVDNPLADYQQKWFENNEQELDDWEYFYYGIPAGNEVFIGLGD